MIKDERKDRNFKVTIFGSSRVKKKDPLYNEIKELARKIGERDMDLITGGGPGLMEAASKGHRVGSKGNKKIQARFLRPQELPQ